MKELQYPFDAALIMSSKRRIKKQLLQEKREYIKKNVAILGGSTTNDIKLGLELFLLEYGIMPEFYESEYNQYYQDAIFPNEKLAAFKPDVIYICTSNRNITTYPSVSHTNKQIEDMLHCEVQKFRSIWAHLTDTYHCPIIQNNFELPFYRLLGNKDASDIHGAVNYVTRLNMEFYSYAQSHDNFYICDINYISADYGLKEWSDPFYWHMYKYALNISAIPHLSFNVANIIKSLFGKNKKGFVLDLDNTLWGGVIGDDGMEHIVIGPDESEGQAYLEFQNYIKRHKELGILLNINSKNDYENAISGLNHPDGVLKPEDFLIMKANWNAKDINLKEIASELTLLPESLVFIDDNPAERAIVTEQIPGVCAPPVTDISHFIQIIDRAGYFEATTLSKDDLSRNEMYKENLQRSQTAATYENYSDYLLSLEMEAVIKPFDEAHEDRITQLTNKSNQFNLTTKRYTQTEVASLINNPHYIALYGKLKDRFGDNGLISIVIGRIDEDICHIDLWLMSCRVLKRDMEFAMMDALVKHCILRGINKLIGYYYPSSKNHMVQDFYALQGFTKIDESEDGSTRWEFAIDSNYISKNTVVKMEE